jgi:hypothetical protein
MLASEATGQRIFNKLEPVIVKILPEAGLVTTGFSSKV